MLTLKRILCVCVCVSWLSWRWIVQKRNVVIQKRARNFTEMFNYFALNTRSTLNSVFTTRNECVFGGSHELYSKWLLVCEYYYFGNCWHFNRKCFGFTSFLYFLHNFPIVFYSTECSSFGQINTLVTHILTFVYVFICLFCDVFQGFRWHIVGSLVVCLTTNYHRRTLSSLSLKWQLKVTKK